MVRTAGRRALRRQPRHLTTDDISAAYDRWADSYDSDHNATRDLDARALREADLPLAGRVVLELGCGTGKNTVWLAENAARVIAFDFSEGMLALARVKTSAAEFVRQDLREAWPLRDASVDVVVGNLVLEHVQDVTRVFAEIARVLRPGGEVLLSELHPLRQSAGAQAQFTDSHTGERIRVPAFVHTVDEFRDAARAAGLRLVRFDERVEDNASSPLPRLLVMHLSA